MTFATAAQRSVSQHRVLVEIDIGIPNEQHINNGAGIWCVNANNIYPWVGPPNQDMVARYALDSDATDSTGNGNDGTLPGGGSDPTFSGGGAQFDGDDDYITLPAAVCTLVNAANPWSIMARVKLDTLTPTNTYSMVVSIRDGGTQAVEIWYFKTWGEWQVVSHGGTGYVDHIADATTDIVDLVITFDGTTLRTYADGIAGGTDDSITTAGILGDSGVIGARGNDPTIENFDGLIKELRFYDYTLTAAEALELSSRNFTAEYFLTGFTAQGFRPIGSVKVDGASLQLGTSTADLADTPRAWYYDGANAMVYYTMPNFDEPSLHTVQLGEVYAYARGAFRPIGGPVPVEGRLVNTPAPSESRDPLFFGRFRYPAISVQLANGDGELDTWGRDIDIYGNDCRVLIGAEDLSYSEYLKVFTGFMQSVTVSEETISISVSDKRKQLTKPLTYATTNTNALTAIEEILAEAYGYTVDSTFYDLDAWNTAKALVANVTLDYQEPAAAIDVIEYIASSVFGLFRVDADNLFSFKITDWAATPVARIPSTDILNAHSISYNPTEVVSSVRVGYDRDWATSGNQYTYYTDDSREETVFNTYKTYQERTFDTGLIDEAAAIAFATQVLDYVDTVRGTETITIPIANYGTELADLLWVESDRGTQPMLGMQSAEVLGLSFPGGPLMDLTIRTIEDTLSAGGLKAYYSFDADSSVDDSGNGNDGTDTDITYEAGKAGQAARFNGTTSYITLPAGAYGIFTLQSAWSMSAWVNTDDLDPTETFVQIFRFNNGSAFIAIAWDDTVNRWYGSVADAAGGNTTNIFGNTGTIGIGEWHHVILSCDGAGTISFYEDGSVTDTGDITGLSDWTANAGWLGGLAGIANFDGLMDEVRIYNRVLADFEVRELFDNPGLT